MPHVDVRGLEVIAPHFKRRLSGVTSTVIQLVPRQRALGLPIATLGPGLPAHLPSMRWRDLWKLWRRPPSGGPRVWHARRNVEMAAGILLRDVLRMPLRLLFTSDAQRRHKGFTKWLIRRMDAVVSSNALAAGFLDVPHDVVVHGVDTARFAPSPDRRASKAALGLDPDARHIGCFGRVRHQKGTDLLVDALVRQLPPHPRWTALICGRVTAENEGFARDLKARIGRAGLEGRILLLGEVPDVVPYYQAIDLFVAPSRNEGFGLTPIEAMACGVAVVTSDAGAYGDMVEPGVNGLICPAGDGDALASAIGAMLSDPARLDTMGRAALEGVRQRYALDIEVEGLRQVYDRVRGAPVTGQSRTLG